MIEQRWWDVRVFDKETRTYTSLSKYGTIDGIIDELIKEGLWEFVSAKPENYCDEL